ncbi:MAG: hypothetical protein A2W25_03995 [candidate division Zixibacteria bacterium RBG_16_53_22]|nr:MAG: hypothetical protein A2W25_03995 [candidate division Zixibacteria bacterium RBG_16_53_22]
MHQAYLTIAANAYLKYTLINKQTAYYKYANTLDSLRMHLFFAHQRREQLIISIIFSALCLEAFINHYAISNFDKSYFNNYIESLPIKKKWMIIPKLITGKSFKMGSQEMTKLKSLFDMRDKLVHYKTIFYKSFDHYKSSDTEATRIVSAIKAKNALLAVSSCIKGLKKLDPEVDSAWIKNALDPLVENSLLKLNL